MRYTERGRPYKQHQGAKMEQIDNGSNGEDRKRAEKTWDQSLEHASVLMNSPSIGMNVIEDDQIVDANDTFLRMTGYTREDLRTGRMNWVHMTPPEYLVRTRQAHQELATRLSMTPYEKEYVCKDGSRLPVLVGAVVLPSHLSQSIAFVLDNSARQELEQRTDAFLSMVSHELRTPLTAVKAQTQLLKRRLSRQGLHEMAATLAKIEEPTQRLERFIGDLMDTSKIQAGRLEYVQELVDLDALLHEIAETMQQMSPTHSIVLRGGIEHALVGDKIRLEQVSINLISNAIKYSPAGSMVEIEMCSSSETATIRVRDQGIGIPKEQHEKIFERFYRVADLSQRAISGLGMGLYIVAEIVKQHEGTITVESEMGKGSTFQLTLPLSRKEKSDESDNH